MNNSKKLLTIASCLVAALALACGSQGDLNEEEDTEDEVAGGARLGRINAALTVPQDAKHDIVMVQFNVVAADGDCSDQPLATTTTAIEEEALVPSLETALEVGYTAFADGLMTLPPGDYKVCVQPLKADGSASDECASAEATASVFSELTTEIVVVSQCDGIANGALDVVATFNDPPLITDIKIGESKFITTCETATIDITAEDPNKDDLTYSWEQVSGPNSGAFVGTGASATFAPSVAGDYEFKVTVFDTTGAKTSLTFPIHVSEADGECAAVCPEGTFSAGGFCFVQAEAFESGIASCARFGLSGSPSEVVGVHLTAELMDEITTAIGCDNAGKAGCCESGLFIDTNANSCSTTGFFEDNGQNFVNALTIPGRTTAMHLCQRP